MERSHWGVGAVGAGSGGSSGIRPRSASSQGRAEGPSDSADAAVDTRSTSGLATVVTAHAETGSHGDPGAITPTPADTSSPSAASAAEEREVGTAGAGAGAGAGAVTGAAPAVSCAGTGPVRPTRGDPRRRRPQGGGSFLAARLERNRSRLLVRRVARRALPTGGVRVRVESVHVLSFTGQLLRGSLPFRAPLPFTPGVSAVGVIVEVNDVPHLAPGQRVFADALHYTRNNDKWKDWILIGWSGSSPRSQLLQHKWPDGSFAEEAVFPAECCTLVPPELDGLSTRLCAVNYLGIAYGGFERTDLRAGGSIIITGATGNLGACAVACALAAGAGLVYAVGRSKEKLLPVLSLDERRVRAVVLPDEGDEGTTGAAVLAQIPTGADAYLDCLGFVTTADIPLACLSALRHRGTAVFIGGASCDVPINYPRLLATGITIRGNFMYDRHVPGVLMRWIRGGTLNLDAFRFTSFPLRAVNDAIEAASSPQGLHLVVLTPQEGLAEAKDGVGSGDDDDDDFDEAESPADHLHDLDPDSDFDQEQGSGSDSSGS